MPEPEDVDELVGVIVQSMIDGRREIRYDIRSRELQVK
jgi:hypothetical protein